MKKITAALAFLLTLVMLFGVTSVFAGAAEQSQTSDVIFDFSHPSAVEKTEIKPSDLLSKIYPSAAVSEIEKDYLDNYSNCFFLINDSFSNDVVSINYSNGVLDVKALKYSYTAVNGIAVEWIPYNAELRGISAAMTPEADGGYTCRFEGVSSGESTYVIVNYSCTVSVSAENANYLINYAYNDAAEASESIKQYEAVFGEYLESYRKYEQYLEDYGKYLSEKQNYERYLELKAEYDRDYEKYAQYLAALGVYEAELAAYNQYLAAYNQYLSDLAEYNRIYNENIGAMDEYKAYYAQINNIRSKMYAIENVYRQPSTGHNSLFTALQNKELVSMFERYRSELGLYGVKPATIDEMSARADALNVMLNEYSNARKTSEQAAFAYYYQHYNEITSLFNGLYDSMMTIITPTMFNHICKLISMDYSDPAMAEYKRWRITNVLAQVYMTARCLDDSLTTQGSWSFYSYEGRPFTYYFTDLIAPNNIISDTNAASPAGLSWPTNKPSFTLPELPVEPQRVAEPLKPAVVNKPIEPTVYSEPIAPTPVNNPGDPPSELDDLLDRSDILEAYESGALAKRAPLVDDVSLTFYYSTSKLVSFDNRPIMTVYDHDHSIIFDTEIVGDAFELPSNAPARDQDEKKVYTFAGWSVSPFELVSPTGENAPDITKDFSIYAVYSSEDRLYKITWELPSGRFTEYYKYKELPECKESTDKAPTNTKVYSFSGWFPKPQHVTGDATYVAEYRESERKYSVKWATHGKTFKSELAYGALPVTPNFEKSYIEDCALYEFSAWDKTVGAVRGDVTYTAIYNKTVLVSADSGTVTLKNGSFAYDVTSTSYSVTLGELLKLAGGEGKSIELKLGECTVSISEDAVRSLVANKASKVSLSFNKDEAVKLSVVDARGNAARCLGDIRINVPSTKAPGKTFCVFKILSEGVMQEIPYSHKDETVTFIIEANVEYKLKQMYSVTVFSSENGGVVMDRYVYDEGESLFAVFYPDVGYEVKSIAIIRLDTGERVNLTSLADYKMPPSDISVTVGFDKITYYVQFIVNGEMVAQGNYLIGEVPIPPQVEEKYVDGEYQYIFAGWTPAVSGITNDTTYIARYNKFLLGDNMTNDPGDPDRAFLNQTVIPIISIGIVFVCAIVSLVFGLKYVFKMKKLKKQ